MGLAAPSEEDEKFRRCLGALKSWTPTPRMLGSKLSGKVVVEPVFRCDIRASSDKCSSV
jgi:hypothetical protein